MDHLATIKKLKVNHPDFACTYRKGGVNHSGPVVIFNRDVWIKPTAEQTLDFEVRRKLVESLGGRMNKLYFEIAGKNPAFSEQDISDIFKAVRRDLKGYKIVDSWNGIGCYALSVAVLKKD